MSGEPARRTPTGRSLRLVSDEGTGPAVPDTGEDASVALPPQRKSVAVGRHWVVRVAAAAGVTGMANQIVELLTSELLANAVLHGADGQVIGLRVRCGDEAVRVEVTDSVTQEPRVLHPAPVAPGGRGMAIVEAMSSRWGVEPDDEGGKTVWFELDVDAY